MASTSWTADKRHAPGDGDSNFHAARESAHRPTHSPRFLEVLCRSSGNLWRFAPGTEAGFAVDLLNRRSAGVPWTSHIEAFKEGDVPVCFGPSAVLVDYGHGWKLQTVAEQGWEGLERRPTRELEQDSSATVVHFRAFENPKEDDFCLELLKKFDYDEVVSRVAIHIGVEDPTRIRLTSHNCYSKQPKLQPIRYRGEESLLEMLVHFNQTSDILYYEVLDIPLPDLECLTLKTLKIAFHHATKDKVVVHTIRLPKNNTVGDLFTDLKTKVELSNPNSELRLLEIFYHKIFKVIPASEKIENLNDQYWTLRAEEILEDEKNLGPKDLLIHVYHFMKDPKQNPQFAQNFGDPFFLVIHEGEKLSKIKLRIQMKLKVPYDEFAKWKFAFLSMGRPTYLEDSDVVSTHFQRKDVYGPWEQYLGLEHSDTTPKRT